MCWGNSYGGRTTPPAGAFTSVSVGYNFACALRDNGTLACWGIDDARWNITVPPTGTFIQLSAGGYHNAALRPDGSVVVWGLPWGAPPAGTYVQVNNGGYHGCALKPDRTLACWGSNSYGQAVPQPGAFAQISPGYDFNCGVRPDGSVTCWGKPGALDPPAGVQFTQVDTGESFACGITVDGDLRCWGTTFDERSTPPGGKFSQIALVFQHACAVRTNGTLTCWGQNYGGQAPRIALTPATLPDGAYGVAYHQAFSASGGTAPYTFVVVNGELPPGITLSTAGQLNGVPSAGGIFTFTISVADAYAVPFSVEQPYTITVTVLDDTPPVITPDVSGTLGSNDWYVSDATASWTVTYPESPVTFTSGCDPTTVNTDTAGVTLTCTATSVGGISSQSVTIKLDKTGPSASLTVTAGTPGAHDWYTSDVTVSTSGSDDVSGPVTCTADQYQTIETAGTDFNGSCANDAGLITAAAPLTVKLDKTKPTIAGAASPAANGAGWNNTPVAVSFTCTDAGGSGIDVSTVAGATLSGDGANQSVTNTGTCIDVASNTAIPATVSGINIDQTEPSFEACPAGGPFAYGSGSQPIGPIGANDSTSLIDSGASTLTGSVDTSAIGTKSVVFTAKDNAGNSAAKTCTYEVTINAAKQAVRRALAALLPTNNKKTDEQIRNAIEHIDKSLAPELWADGSHLTKKGQKVFDEEKKAVGESPEGEERQPGCWCGRGGGRLARQSGRGARTDFH